MDPSSRTSAGKLGTCAARCRKNVVPQDVPNGTEGAAGRYALQKKNLGYVHGDGINPVAWIITKNEKNVKKKKEGENLLLHGCFTTHQTCENVDFKKASLSEIFFLS